MTLTAFELRRALATGIEPAEWAKRAEKLRARYTIEVLDNNLRSLGQLECWDGLQVVHRLCDVGTGTVKAAATAHNRELLGDYRGRTVVVYQNGMARQAGKLRVGGEDQDETSVMTLAWDNPLQFLVERQAYPNPGDEVGDGPATHDIRGGWTTTAVLGFVDANAGPSACPGRQADGLVMGVDPQAGAWLDAPIAAQYETLADLVRGFAIPNGVVYNVITRGRQHVFQPRQIRDLRSSVQFSRQLHNLRTNSRRLNKPGATRVLVLGPEFDGRRMKFLVQTDESRAQEAAWGISPQIVRDSTSVVVHEAAQAAAEVEVGNLKTWVDSFKDGLKNLTDAYRKLDRILRDLDLRLGEKYIGPVTAADIAAERDLVIKVCDEIGFQLSIIERVGIDVDEEKDLDGEVLAALVELKRARDGYQQGGTDTPGHSIINGVAGAIDALHRVQHEYPTDFNVEQQVAIDEAKEAFGFVGAKVDVFLSAQPVVAQYRQKALDFLAAAYVANRELTFHTLYAAAERDLQEQGETAEFTADIVQGIYQLDTGDGGDFGIGDVVRCYFDGYPEPIDRLAREATETVSVGDGQRMVIVIGDPGATSSTGATVRTRDVLRRLERLQVRS